MCSSRAGVMRVSTTPLSPMCRRRKSRRSPPTAQKRHSVCQAYALNLEIRSWDSRGFYFFSLDLSCRPLERCGGILPDGLNWLVVANGLADAHCNEIAVVNVT